MQRELKKGASNAAPGFWLEGVTGTHTPSLLRESPYPRAGWGQRTRQKGCLGSTEEGGWEQRTSRGYAAWEDGELGAFLNLLFLESAIFSPSRWHDKNLLRAAACTQVSHTLCPEEGTANRVEAI
jgi:hypothetical protein